MFPIIIGKIRCYFCNKDEGFMHSVHRYGIYDDPAKRHFYHPECLEIIEMEPEKSGSAMMDKALHIITLKESNNDKFNEEIIPKFRASIEKLRESSFDRMIKGDK